MPSRAPTPSLLTTLSADHPEWRPLLVLIEQTLREIEGAQWTSCVPALEDHGGGERPLLDGAIIHVPPRLVDRWIGRLLKSAAEAGTEVDRLVSATAAGRLDPLLLFKMAVSRHVDCLDELARVHEDDRGVVRALAPLIAMPMLQACRSAWADRVPTDWASGYCPICGGWPAFAESRGLDGRRYLRCAACGSAWRIEWLRCPFCGESDHRHIGALMSPARGESQTVQVCETCGSYVKIITTLTPIGPRDVVLRDLAMLVLDVAALERDYHRPAAATHRVEVRVVTDTSQLWNLLGSRS